MIRAATARDASRIAFVHVESWRSAYRDQLPEEFLAGLDAARRVERWQEILRNPDIDSTVVELEFGDRSDVVGFCVLLPSRDADADPQTAEISAIYLLESSWRHGLGRQLFQHASRRAAERGFARLTLWVLRTNERAHAFYSRLGMERDGEEKTETNPEGVVFDEVRYRMRVGP